MTVLKEVNMGNFCYIYYYTSLNHPWSPQPPVFNVSFGQQTDLWVLCVSFSRCIFILIASLSSLHLYPHCISIPIASLSSLHLYPPCIFFCCCIFILIASLSLLHLYFRCIFIFVASLSLLHLYLISFNPLLFKNIAHVGSLGLLFCMMIWSSYDIWQYDDWWS